MIVTRKRRGRRGLGYSSEDAGADSAYLELFAGQPADLAVLSAGFGIQPSTPSAPSGCSTWDMLYGNLTGDYSGCIVNNQAVIQQVPINAAAAGYSPAVVAVTQQTASQQEAMVPSDVATIVASQDSGTPSWVWLALGGVALFAVAELLK